MQLVKSLRIVGVHEYMDPSNGLSKGKLCKGSFCNPNMIFCHSSVDVNEAYTSM